MKFKTFWVVTKPTPRSTISDICFQVDAESLARQFLGGLEPEEIHAFYTKASEAETDALISLLCAMAERLYPMLRQLLSASEPEAATQQRWQLFRSRLDELVRERLNPRRGGVQKLLDPQEGLRLQRQLVQGLAFGAGRGGFDRLKASLMDAVA